MTQNARVRALVVIVLSGAISALAVNRACSNSLDGAAGRLGAPQSLTDVERFLSGNFRFPAPQARNDQPHPAVVRVVVPEGEATSYGSGTLVDVRDQFGLVVTNWHVVRDHRGEVEVHFPDGFHSKARPLKVDKDWDLAALIIWRPPVPPVKVAATAPQPGDRLTICGYGSGKYRAVTGRCTQYYAPAIDLPQHMVELDVEARQGDSGGPIFNEQGELAGVLFGAVQGATLGSFGGRVESFLADLAPDIGRAADHVLVQSEPTDAALSAARASAEIAAALPDQQPADVRHNQDAAASNIDAKVQMPREPIGATAVVADLVANEVSAWQSVAVRPAASNNVATASAVGDWTSHGKNVLAAIGAIYLVVLALKAVR